MKIGILGGTFNPIHIGHLIVAEHIREFFPLDKVIFIPAGVPPHKKHVETWNDRFNMVNLSIMTNPNFLVSSIEIEREGNSFTIDTIKILKYNYVNDDLFFIIGADSLLDLKNWHKFDELLKLVKFIVVGRECISEKSILDNIEQLKSSYGSNIYYLWAPLINVSSTEIRKKVNNNKSIKYLVTESVENYINEHELYKE